MNSPHIPSAIGVSGLVGTLTLSDINTFVAICVGLTTLTYLAIKIFKELKDANK